MAKSTKQYDRITSNAKISIRMIINISDIYVTGCGPLLKNNRSEPGTQTRNLTRRGA